MEEPRYEVVQRIGGIAIRQYPARIAAETTVHGSEQRARDIGFRRVAGYIFGDNHARAKIAMTAPVAQATAGNDKSSDQRIPMTAPVAQTRAADGTWTISFFMPAASSLRTLPAPNDALVRLVAIPAETYAVLRFAGTPTPAAVARQDKKLLDGLHGSGWSAIGRPVAWFYNPPWTLPPLRRNEVAIRVARSTA